MWLAEGRLDEAQRELNAVLNSQDQREAAFGSVKHKALLARVALLLAQGRGDEAGPVIEAQVAAMQAMPRENQYRDVLFQVHDLAARAAARQGRHAQTRAHFEQAIDLLEAADDQHPYLAMTRAHYAQWLLSQRGAEAAKRQVDLAAAALRGHPQIGSQFWRPLREAEALLARAERKDPGQ